MKKRIMALVTVCVLALGAAFALAEGAADSGEALIGRWAVTADSLENVLELPADDTVSITVEIARQGEFFDILMNWSESPDVRISWTLTGSYDPENEEIFGFGSKTRFGLDAAGEVISADLENDEVNAEFYLVENGLLTWWDSDEGLEGVLFERVPEEAAE